MQYEALLSDQEKNAFSDFLNQIANGDNVTMPSQFLHISSAPASASTTIPASNSTSGSGSNNYYPSYSDSRPLSLNFQSPSPAAMYIGAEPPSPPTTMIKDEPDPYPQEEKESPSPKSKPKRKKPAPKPKVAGVLPRKATNSKGKQAEADGLLTEEEKKANHIASEQKRRHNIRVGFDQLVQLVPTLNQCHRSEALILQKSVSNNSVLILIAHL